MFARVAQPDLFGGGTNKLIIDKAAQTVESFNLPETAVTTNELLLLARTDQDLTDFTFTCIDGPGVLQSNVLQFTAAGTVRVKAEQLGASNYLPVAVTQSVVVSKTAQASLVFAPAASMTYGTTQALSTTGGSGSGQVSYTVTPTNLATIVDNAKVQILGGTGAIVLTATRAGDALYEEASACANGYAGARISGNHRLCSSGWQ